MIKSFNLFIYLFCLGLGFQIVALGRTLIEGLNFGYMLSLFDDSMIFSYDIAEIEFNRN